MLVAAALVAGAQAPQSQGAMGGAAAALEGERRAQQDARARAEWRARMAQSRAHARMPDTMYASTPDPSAPPHPFPLDIDLKSASERAGLPRGRSARSAMRLTHRIGLFPSAADALGRQGFARIVNRSASDGEVSIVARDDAGTEHGPLTLAIGAGETKHFNSSDLETGNAGKGLDGATGPPGKGAWRLELSSTLDLQVLSYIRTSDGFLTSMHDLVARTEAGQHRVAIFNPGRNANQVSRLRVINPGTDRTEVRIEGIGNAGRSPGEAVVFTLAAGASRTLDARELESGEGLSGGLGTGKGKWRLVVSADKPIEVLNTLSTPTGHLTNLSTVPGPAVSAESAADVFAERISRPIVQDKCIACHVEGGVSGNTWLVFVRDTEPDHEARNLQTFTTFLDEVDDGARFILNKIQGVAHGGGVQVAAGTPGFADMERFLPRMQGMRTSRGGCSQPMRWGRR